MNFACWRTSNDLFTVVPKHADSGILDYIVNGHALIKAHDEDQENQLEVVSII